MVKVKHFVTGASPTVLDYMDNDVNAWMGKHNVTNVIHVTEVYGKAPMGMSGHSEDAIFISIWYVEDESAPPVYNTDAGG